MRRTVWVSCILQLVLPAASSAQRVEGVLVDAQSGRVLPGARVYMLDAGDQPVDSATTTSRGRFALTAPAPGRYLINVLREGYADILSNPITLVGSETVSYRMEVPPLSMTNLRQMSDALSANRRLGEGLSDVCAGRLNPLEGGVLVGVVRGGRAREPIPGARSSLRVPEGPGVAADSVLTAVTDPQGAYLHCFVPAGDSIAVTVTAEGWRPSTQVVQVMRGTVSWYDFDLRRAPGSR